MDGRAEARTPRAHPKGARTSDGFLGAPALPPVRKRGGKGLSDKFFNPPRIAYSEMFPNSSANERGASETCRPAPFFCAPPPYHQTQGAKCVRSSTRGEPANGFICRDLYVAVFLIRDEPRGGAGERFAAGSGIIRTSRPAWTERGPNRICRFGRQPPPERASEIIFAKTKSSFRKNEMRKKITHVFPVMIKESTSRKSILFYRMEC